MHGSNAILVAMPPPGTNPPEAITVHRASRTLELRYPGGQLYALPFELLRVYSPSAEVRGHGPGQEVLQTGKRLVIIEALEPVGNYAVQPRFSDGHDSGIYSWDFLFHLAQNQDTLWADYLARLEAAGIDRDAPMPAAAPSSGSGCASH